MKLILLPTRLTRMVVIRWEGGLWLAVVAEDGAGLWRWRWTRSGRDLFRAGCFT